jgi:hypothetical protein
LCSFLLTYIGIEQELEFKFMFAKFEILVTVIRPVNITVLWDMTSWSLVGMNVSEEHVVFMFRVEELLPP